LTLGVGLGNPPDDFSLVGEEADNRVRASKLDEGLDVLTGLWSGQPFSYEGEHFRLDDVQLRPRPVQRPRIPIWVAGQWPNRRAWRRAARYEGVYPVKNDGLDPLSLDEMRTITDEVAAHRRVDGPFDVVVGAPAGTLGAHPNAPTIRDYVDAGATWWITEIHDGLGTLDEMCKIVRDGPPAP
jgi:alkanesulfonate monooxygenase SsuD/methylene tetrahydromethanopterin reductase-like flavin-dependent oxidoreductase (luciferase family)